MNMTEQKIRLAAIKLIAQGGYESMSLRQLAREAGVNVSVLYLYYKGKQELLLTLVLEYFEQLADAWARSCPANVGTDSLVQAFVAFHVRHHLGNKDKALLGNMELRSLDDEELAMVAQARRAYLGTLQKILEQGIREGSLRCDEPKLMTRIVFGMLTQACAWYREDGRMGVDEVIVYYTGLVLRALGWTGRCQAEHK